MNRFGTQFRLALWGESHGPQIGLTIDGVPAGPQEPPRAKKRTSRKS